MARNNDPEIRQKTPLLICSIRTEIPYPCIGSSANVFRMSISSVPWTRSLGLSGIKIVPPWLPGGAYASPSGCQEERRKYTRTSGYSSHREKSSLNSFVAESLPRLPHPSVLLRIPRERASFYRRFTEAACLKFSGFVEILPHCVCLAPWVICIVSGGAAV